MICHEKLGKKTIYFVMYHFVSGHLTLVKDVFSLLQTSFNLSPPEGLQLAGAAVLVPSVGPELAAH